METLERMSGEDEAVQIINTVVAEHGKNASGSELSKILKRESQENASIEAQHKVSQYIDGMQDATRGAAIQALEPGVGGMYDGSMIAIAQSTLEVSESIDRTIDRLEEVSDHEQFHKKNNHTKAMIHGTSEDGAAASFGGETFTETELIEGWTVKNTGNRFVSNEYREFEERLQQAMQRAGLSNGDISRAIDKEKDLRILEKSAEEKPEESVTIAA